MRYQLERYRGRESRHNCPQCGRREFARYISESGDYLSPDVGRCNRESKCSYHKPPRDHFAENGLSIPTRSERLRPRKPRPPRTVDCLAYSLVGKTLRGYEQNGLYRFLTESLLMDSESVRQKFLRYSVGTSKEGRTVFWQIDSSSRVRSGKLISYDPSTGKRLKDAGITWVHSELKRIGMIPETFGFQQCFFGEHLLDTRNGLSVGIVESEKTALICSLFESEFPDILWLATGGKSNLSIERFRILDGRRILLFPDGDSFEEWADFSNRLRRVLPCATVKVSTAIEESISVEAKGEGFDLADLLCGFRGIPDLSAGTTLEV